MRLAWRLVVGALLLSLCVVQTTGLRAEDSGNGVVVLLNPRNPTSKLSKAQVQNLFLGKTAFWHGVVPVKVFVRPSGTENARLFYEKVLDMSGQSFAKHWDKLQLSGRGVAPKSVDNIQDLVKQIAANPGAIAFASASEAWQVSGAKVVEVQ